MIPWASDIHNCHVLWSPSLSIGQKNSFIYSTKSGHLHSSSTLQCRLKSKFHHRSALLLIAVFQISLFALLLISAKRRQMLSLIFLFQKGNSLCFNHFIVAGGSFLPTTAAEGRRQPTAAHSADATANDMTTRTSKKAFIKLCRWTSPSL